MEITTHDKSNAILTFPKFLLKVSEIAFTNASPEFKTTFALTESEIPNPRTMIPTIIKRKAVIYELTGMNAINFIPRSVNQPKKNDRGICKNWTGLKFFRSKSICPKIMIQFQIMSQFPKERDVNLQLKTFATEEIGETPSPACFANATPKAEKKRPVMNNI